MKPPGEAALNNRTSTTYAWHWHVAALGCYAIIAAIFIDHGESLTQRIAGHGTDPFIFIWFFAWWPWAISHHLDLLYSPLVWQPEGVYLGWVTSMPLLAILGWPLTLISPVLTFNIFIILGPVLTAWMGYFLCLRIAREPATAIIGGFLFGFSSYEMAQDTAVLNLSFTCCVPLLLLIVLTRLDDELGRVRLIVFGGLALICQFLVSIEIFGMIFVFGGIAWALGLIYLPTQRPALLRLVADALWTAPFVVLVLSPFLLSMALHADSINLPSLWPYYFVADPLNFFIPSADNLLGRLISLPISIHFNGGIQEQDSYIGLPLILIIALFARTKRRAHSHRFLLRLLLLLLLASLGPRLWVGGEVYRAALPWALFVHLPLLDSALPTRFALFASLLVSIIAVLWMSAVTTQRQRVIRQGVGLMACIFLLPQTHPWMKLPESRFFQPGHVEATLGKNSRILVLPFSIQGPSPFWQAQTHFGFLQTGGYLGFPPRRMQQYPATGELFGGFEGPHFASDVKEFCVATHTQFIVVGPGTTEPVVDAIAGLNWPMRKLYDVVVYTVPGSASPS